MPEISICDVCGCEFDFDTGTILKDIKGKPIYVCPMCVDIAEEIEKIAKENNARE